jgi:dienelactone hydrolase
VARRIRHSQQKALGFERCEERSLATLVFVLNGNGLGAASPNDLTANAAFVLHAAGDQPVQLANPAVVSVGVLRDLEREIGFVSHGQPIGIVGFSAGATLAERIASDPALNVTAVLAYYGPPDLRDYLAYHRGDGDARYVLEHINFNRGVIAALSGPNPTQAYVVAAFGLDDHNVVAGPSSASFHQIYPQGKVYTYPGPHGVGIDASRAALEDFLTHL